MIRNHKPNHQKPKTKSLKITNQIIKNQTKLSEIISQYIAFTYKCLRRTYRLILHSHELFSALLGHWAIYKAIRKARKCINKAAKNS